jgi:hypothetical protein
MKATLLLPRLLATLTLFFTINNGSAQCEQEVTDFGNNVNIPQYNISGDVDVTLNADNTISLDLGSNFATAAGPDIRAFLVNSNGLSDTALRNSLISELENIEFGLVGCTSCGLSQNGAKSFTVAIPNTVDIEDFDKVFFYCLQFDQFWDFGTHTSFSDSNCSILNIEDIALNTISLYPNPAKDAITLKGKTNQEAEIYIYNVLGELVTEKTQNFNSIIDISELESGLYLVQISFEGNQTTKRLIIE